MQVPSFLTVHINLQFCYNYVLLVFIQMSASKIVYLRFQDSRGITREVDKHNYPPCFRVKVNRRNFQTQLDVNFDICVPSAEVLSTLNLFVPGNVNFEVTKVQ